MYRDEVIYHCLQKEIAKREKELIGVGEIDHEGWDELRNLRSLLVRTMNILLETAERPAFLH